MQSKKASGGQSSHILFLRWSWRQILFTAQCMGETEKDEEGDENVERDQEEREEFRGDGRF